MNPANSPATLLEAVEQNDLKQLRELIAAGADVNESEEDTALSKAAELGRTGMVRELLKAGADANSGGLHVPLCAAVNSGVAEIVELLLKARAEVDAQEEAGESALMLAAARGDLKILKRLLKAGANPKLPDEDGQTAIVYGRRWPKVVELLKPLSAVEDVAFVAQATVKIAAEVESLLAAAKADDTAQVQKLLKSGAAVNGANENGETPLHIAVSCKHLEIVELLLQAGADVNAENQLGRTPLWEAAGDGNIALIKRLLGAGAAVNAPDKIDGKTPFLTSIGPRKENRDAMLLLAKNGADVRAADMYGQTALSLADRYISDDKFADATKRKEATALREVLTELGLLHRDAAAFAQAASRGDAASVASFLAKGLLPDVVDDQERTALYMAISRQHPAVVRQLLDVRADMHKAVGHDDKQDVQWGGYALACPQCGTEFVSILPDRDCPKCHRVFNPQKQFGSKLGGAMFFTWCNGHLPLMVAARVNHPQIISMLVAAGADVDRGKDGLSALMVACYFGHLSAARELLKRGADANRQTKTPDRLRETISPVLLAAKGKHWELVKLLWDTGVPATDKNPTLLVAAAEAGDLAEITRLIKAGAHPNAQDSLTGEWPLSVAAQAGHVEAVKALITAGASAIPAPRQMAPLLAAMSALEYKNRQGLAGPAVVKRYVAVAKSLLATGAKANSRTFGVSPLSLAEDMNCREMVEALKAV